MLYRDRPEEIGLIVQNPKPAPSRCWAEHGLESRFCGDSWGRIADSKWCLSDKSLSQRSDHRSGSRRFGHAAKQSLSRRIAPYEPGAMRYPMAES